MSVKLLTEHHFEFLSLTGCITGSSESTLVKIPNCWKSRVTAQMLIFSYPSLRNLFLDNNFCQNKTAAKGVVEFWNIVIGGKSVNRYS